VIVPGACYPGAQNSPEMRMSVRLGNGQESAASEDYEVDDSARALMLGTGLTTTWPGLGCPAVTATDEGRSRR
jgi:hypothetical protein